MQHTFITTEKLYDLFIQCNQNITTDTRKLGKGSIFFALKGDNFNANTFAQKAIEGGCAYAIVDDTNAANGTTILLVNNVLETLQQLAKYHRSKLTIPIIGITGSNGKTTNKELVNIVLSQKYKVYATIGNLNNHIGVPLTLLAITEKHEIAIVEMGANHQGEIELLSELANPNYGLITNIGKAHLEGFGGVEGIKKGKSELYKHLKKNNGKLFINANDAVLMNLSGDIEKITYGNTNEYNIYGELIQNSEFVAYRWNTKNKPLESEPIITTHLFGHYNFINVLTAICIGNYFDVPKHLINKALQEYVPEMNRSQIKKTEHNTLVLDAYNANPSSLALAIENFVNQNLPNKLFIIGDMLELGSESETEHELILKLLQHTNQKQVICVGPLFNKLQHKYPQFLYFINILETKLYLQKQNITQNTIFIKGSRGIKLEQLVENL